MTSINGATQIRAGVVRPEIIIPVEGQAEAVDAAIAGDALNIGTPIRIIREPYFGQLGRVSDLPVELQELETEAKVRVLEVELEDGNKVVLSNFLIQIVNVNRNKLSSL